MPEFMTDLYLVLIPNAVDFSANNRTMALETGTTFVARREYDVTVGRRSSGRKSG